MSSTFRRFALGASNPKFYVSVAAMVLLAACSAESDRFAENPSDTDPVYTASVPQQTQPQAVLSDEIIGSRPLKSASVQAPAYDYSKSYKAPQYKQQAVAQAPAVDAPEANTPELETPAVSTPRVANVEPPQAAAGGSVTVGSGMTLYSIARANNLSVSQLASANGIRAPYSVHSGQTLRIPGSSAPALPQTTAAARPATPAKPFKQGREKDSGCAAGLRVRIGKRADVE